MKTRRDLLRRIVAMALCMFIVTGMFGICASAAESETEGWLSDEISWKLSVEKGELRISGIGAINDFQSDDETYPWTSLVENIVSLVIEDGITSVGSFVFNNLSYLETVTFGNTLETISTRAFYECYNINDINISASVKDMDGSSFYKSGIKKIIVDSENKYFCSTEDGVLFSKDLSTIVLYPRANGATSYTIPSGVQTVGAYAFALAPLEEIIIPYGVEVIGDSAFAYNARLIEVKIPESVKEFGDLAFEGCHRLENINIPDSIERIGDFAFRACFFLDDFELPDKVIKIGRSIFGSNSSYYENAENWFDGGLYCGKHLLETTSDETDMFITKEGTINVASCAFMHCGAKTVIIADSVKYVGNKSFWGNNLTEKVIFCSSVETIDSYAFWGADVKQVIFHEGVKEIGSYAFWGAENIETLTIPGTVTAIPAALFFGARSLKTIYLRNTIESIESSAFYSTASLTDIYYYGTKVEWDSIDMVENTVDESVTIHYLGDLSDHVHNFKTHMFAEATCIERGYKTEICNECGMISVAGIYDALGHDFGDWTVTKEPTETEHGKRERTCERCGLIEEQSIGMLPPTSDTALIKVGDVTARPGKTVEVTVSIENNPGIVATHLMLRYDSDILTLTEVRDGGLFGTGKMVAGKDLTDMPYNVIWSDALSEVNHTNDGVLVTFVFTVSENAPEGETPITIEYYAESTFNADLDPVEFEVENGSVKIVKRLAGDANGDGFVNLKDAVIIERYLAGGWGVTVVAENADVNGDGKVSLMDSVLIKRYLANWDVELI